MEAHGTSENRDVIEIPVGKYISKLKGNPWVAATFVFAIVAIVLLIILAVRPSGAGGDVVSADKAGENLVGFINAQGNGNAEVVSSEKDGALYKVTVSYNGQNIPVFVSLDGKYLIDSPVLLSADSAAPNSGSSVSGPVDIEIGGSPVIGNSNASVTVVEFSDFSCPFCAAASGHSEEMLKYMKSKYPTWEPIVTNLMKDYVETGKIKFAVKYAKGHGGGHPAQLVAWCLNEQSLYWKFYEKAYGVYADTEDLSKMKDLAKGVGADMTKLQTCLDSKKYDSRLTSEQNEANKAGLQGTPGFYVNGRYVSGGAIPYSQLKAIVDEELAKSA